jgi:hypothetical protein
VVEDFKRSIEFRISSSMNGRVAERLALWRKVFNEPELSSLEYLKAQIVVSIENLLLLMTVDELLQCCLFLGQKCLVTKMVGYPFHVYCTFAGCIIKCRLNIFPFIRNVSILECSENAFP